MGYVVTLRTLLSYYRASLRPRFSLNAFVGFRENELCGFASNPLPILDESPSRVLFKPGRNFQQKWGVSNPTVLLPKDISVSFSLKTRSQSPATTG